jgi:uncharacterized protein YbjT (DUF2867 family)
VSWTTHAVLAEVTAIILTDEGWFDGATPPLTAPDALDLEDIAGILTELTGRATGLPGLPCRARCQHRSRG